MTVILILYHNVYIHCKNYDLGWGSIAIWQVVMIAVYDSNSLFWFCWKEIEKVNSFIPINVLWRHLLERWRAFEELMESFLDCSWYSSYREVLISRLRMLWFWKDRGVRNTLRWQIDKDVLEWHIQSLTNCFWADLPLEDHI